MSPWQYFVVVTTKKYMRVASDWISLEPYQMAGVWIPLAKELSTFSPRLGAFKMPIQALVVPVWAPSVAVLFGVDTSVICYCDPPLSEARNHLSKFNFRFQA